MSCRLAAVFCFSLFLESLHAQPKGPPIPQAHTSRTLEGWTVHVDNRLLDGDDKALGEHALRILANRLYDIKHVVPADKVKLLQKVPIWLDKSHGKLKPAQYHPSKGRFRGGQPSTRATLVGSARAGARVSRSGTRL